MINISKLLIFSVVLFMSSTALAALPCVVAQVDRAYFSGEESVSIWAGSAHQNSCAQIDFTGEASVRVEMQLYRVTFAGPEFVDAFSASISAGKSKAQLLKRLEAGRYPKGQYFVSTRNGGSFLEEIHFTWGSTDRGQFEDIAPSPSRPFVPYLKAAAIVEGGYMYFPGNMSFAPGYLYQRRSDMLEIMPVEFEPVPSDDRFFAGRPAFRDSLLDLPLVRAKLGNNTFDPNMAVYASVTVGGRTRTVMVYDPSDPSKQMSRGFSGK